MVQHLAVLESCGIVRSEKVGRTRTCRLEPVGLRLAEDWFAGQRALWERRLDRLGEVLADDLRPPSRHQHHHHPREELEMTTRSTEHGTFTVTRTYPVPPDACLRRLVQPGGQGALVRRSGIHRLRARLPGGRHRDQPGRPPRRAGLHATRPTYRDIVPDERIVYGYVMERRRRADLRLGDHGGVRRRTVGHHADLHRAGRVPRRRATRPPSARRAPASSSTPSAPRWPEPRASRVGGHRRHLVDGDVPGRHHRSEDPGVHDAVAHMQNFAAWPGTATR